MLKTMKVELPNKGEGDPVVIPEGKSWMITAYDRLGGNSLIEVDGRVISLGEQSKPLLPEGTELTRYNTSDGWTRVIYVLELNNDN